MCWFLPAAEGGIGFRVLVGGGGISKSWSWRPVLVLNSLRAVWGDVWKQIHGWESSPATFIVWPTLLSARDFLSWFAKYPVWVLTTFVIFIHVKITVIHNTNWSYIYYNRNVFRPLKGHPQWYRQLVTAQASKVLYSIILTRKICHIALFRLSYRGLKTFIITIEVSYLGLRLNEQWAVLLFNIV
jgi:hypothetical protein